MSKKRLLVTVAISLIVLSTFGHIYAINAGKVVNETNTTQENKVENETIVLQRDVSNPKIEPSITQEPLQLATMMEGNPIYDTKVEPRKPTFKVKLRSGEFTPQRGMQSELRVMATEALAKIPMGKTPIPEYVYALVQFNDDTLSEADFNAMQSDGINFLGYLPEDTYIVKMPLGKAQDISYPSVRWMGILKPEQKISPELKDALRGSEPIKVAVSFFDKIPDPDLEIIKNLSVDVYMNSSDFLIVEIPPNRIQKLAELNAVGYLYPWYPPILYLDASQKVVSAGYVWLEGNDASGVSVGVVGGGIQHSHPHFSGVTIYDAYDCTDPYNDVPEADCGESSCSDGIDNDGNGEVDEGSHGVLVAGVISGQGTHNGRTIKGISSNANLVIGRVSNKEGDFSINCIAPEEEDIWKYIIDSDEDGDFFEESSSDIISVSWGEAYTTYTEFAKLMDEVVNGKFGNKKVPIIVAAGNGGTGSNPKVQAPATAKNVIAVGATGDFRSSDNMGQCIGSDLPPDACQSDPNNLYVMKSSSRGDYDEAGRIKPDILAPGADITTSTTGSNYKSAGGTSLAAPHVSAVAAQILKQYPSASPALVKAFMISNAVGGGTTDAIDIDEVWGRLNAHYSIYKLSDEYVDSYDENVVGNILSGQPTERDYTITVPSGAEKLVVTMVYSDDPANVGASSTLVNDLDLFLKKPDGTPLYQSDDNINNVEKYVINNPAAGMWEAHVKAKELADLGGAISKTQDYAISIRVIKSTESPYISVYTYSTKGTVTVGETFDVYANVYSLGLGSYDTWAEIDTPDGLTLLSTDVDGTEAEYDVLGDIPHNSNRQTKHWQFRADTAGTYTITVTAKGRGINDAGYLNSDSVEVVGNPPITPLPDLTLASPDIAWDSTTSQITATIHNTGDADASSVLVEFFNGAPANNDLIGSRTITSITAAGNQDAVVTWNNAPAGTQTVYVVIDSAHLGSGAILESDEGNNIASKSVSVPTKATYVSAITLTPAQPDIYTTTTITTTITNSGGSINNARFKLLWAGPDREFSILDHCTVDFSISSGEPNIEKSCNWDFNGHTGQIFIKAELWDWDTWVLVSALEKEIYVLDRVYELRVHGVSTVSPSSSYITLLDNFFSRSYF